MSKPKRKGGPLRIPTEEEELTKFTLIDLSEAALPVINIILTIIFILLIPNFLIDMLLFFMFLLTIGFFISMILELWQIFRATHPENSILLYSSTNISPYILYAGQFVYGYFFLSFIFLGFIDAVSIISIFIWIYFGFSTLFLILVIWAIVVYIKEAGNKKEQLIKNIMKDLSKYEKTENYAAQSYYLQKLIKVVETPLIKAGFLSKLITFITILLTIFPFIIPA
ncbi:MAG: hypothetical protein JSV62_13740 [Promethearchaeota archaeon]|nr:MAG: hypothetical protein JSV62_13740 [Candidatus Lokiarchaeota archaeon]